MKKILVTFGTETLFILMNDFRILLFQNEENEKNSKFCFFNVSLIDGPLHSYILKPSCVWPKPSFALAPQA